MTLTKIKCLIAALMMIASAASAIWPFTTYYVIYAKAINPRNGKKLDKYYSAGKPWTDGVFTVYKEYETNLEIRIKTSDVHSIDELKEAPKPDKPATTLSAGDVLDKIRPSAQRLPLGMKLKLILPFRDTAQNRSQRSLLSGQSR